MQRRSFQGFVLPDEMVILVRYADFQNFAKSFAYGEYASLMASTTANAAALSGAADLKGRMLEGDGFGNTQLRQVLFGPLLVVVLLAFLLARCRTCLAARHRS